MAIGGLIAVPAGVAAAHKLDERILRFFFCGIILLTAISLVDFR